jgi:hypothetical protein
VREEFRPWFGPALCVGIGLICVVAAVGLLVRDGLGALPALPFLALVGGACWAVFWRPVVAVDDGGVRLVNVLRTIDLPWPSILAIDTKWALTLITAYGQFTAWAAPAPGIHEAIRATKRDAQDLPESTFTVEGIRPGDLPSSSSGGAAMVIRRRLQELRDSGYLENPRLEHERAPVTWHVATIVGGVVLAVLAAVGVLA